MPELMDALGPERPSAIFSLPRTGLLASMGVMSRSLPVLEALLAAGCSPHHGGALSMAVHGNRPDLCEALLKAGADPMEPGQDQAVSALNAAAALPDSGPLRLLLAYGANPNQRDARGVLPLFSCERQEPAQLLLEAGADPLALDPIGRLAAEQARARGRAELADFLASAAEAAALERGLPASPSRAKASL